MVTVFALAAALLYGSADFLGGAATRRAHVLSVLLVSGTAGMAVVLTAALLAGGPPQPAGLAWGICAGAAGGGGAPDSPGTVAGTIRPDIGTASSAGPGLSRSAARGIVYGIASGAAFGMFFLFIRNGGESGALW